MIQIEEYRFLQLARFEEELNQLFENIVLQYVKEWQALYPNKVFGWMDKKDEVSDYVNLNIKANNIIFNGTTPHVWFNSQGAGQMLYWSTKDSRSIRCVDELLEKEKK